MRRGRALLRFAAVIAAVTAGTAVVGNAAGLSLSTKLVGTGTTSIPTCSGGLTIKVATAGAGANKHISSVKITLSSCSGAASGATVDWGLDDTSSGSITNGACTPLSGSPLACTSAGLTLPKYNAGTDTIDVDVVANPGKLDSGVTSGHLNVNSTYLTLSTCADTETQLSGAGGHSC
jgi:hypothetical protein